MMRTFTYDIRHTPTDPFEIIVCELTNETRIYRSTGEVRAWTKWGAKRQLRKRYGRKLIEILEIKR